MAQEPDDAHAEDYPPLVDNRGAFTGNDIVITYNADNEIPGNSNLLRIEPGSAIEGSLLDIQWGDAPPANLPVPRPSTPDERTKLRNEILALADTAESVMLPYGKVGFGDALRMLGIPATEARARQREVIKEIERINHEPTARYNNECRSSVIQVYGHARSIGFADPEMERIWRTQVGVGAKSIPVGLRRVAAKIPE